MKKLLDLAPQIADDLLTGAGGLTLVLTSGKLSSRLWGRDDDRTGCDQPLPEEER